jgi:hypothetical protein
VAVAKNINIHNMGTNFILEKYFSEEQDAYRMGPKKSSERHYTIVPKEDLAGFLYYILPDVRKKSLDDYPYGDGVAMAIKLAVENGKKYIKFSNKNEKLNDTLARLVKDGILKENWENYEILKTTPAPIVEEYSVRSLD